MTVVWTDDTRPARTRYRRVLEVYRETSREALDSVWDVLPAIDQQIVRDIAARDGATSAEIEAATGLKHQTVSAQIRHMAESGLLVDTGARRKNANGRACIVWGLAPRIAPGTPGYLASLPVVDDTPETAPAREGWLFS